MEPWWLCHFLSVGVKGDSLYEGGKNCMGARRFYVHVGWSDVSVFLAFLDHLYNFLKIFTMRFSTIFQKCLAFIFSDLKFSACTKVK
jgi:hypothetical protein